jgi:transposase
VLEHENIICPFCGEKIETIEEDVQDEYDLFEEDSWTE